MAGTLRLTTTAVDDTWPGGHVGVWRASASTTTTLQWDNFKCGNFWILLSDSKVVYEQMML
ncbi:MAG: hypothetical protein JNG88_11090 [Phycisphaerales bacterium]|nr:hypothetical protein [Phycisphaerales bacterium]